MVRQKSMGLDRSPALPTEVGEELGRILEDKMLTQKGEKERPTERF